MKKLLTLVIILAISTLVFAADTSMRKVDDNTVAIPSETTYSIADLQIKKQWIEKAIAELQTELDKVNALIAEAKKVGVSIPAKIGE
jgi:peptidoglycan hydrolase CwlO-like protein